MLIAMGALTLFQANRWVIGDRLLSPAAGVSLAPSTAQRSVEICLDVLLPTSWSPRTTLNCLARKSLNVPE